MKLIPLIIYFSEFGWTSDAAREWRKKEERRNYKERRRRKEIKISILLIHSIAFPPIVSY